MINMKRVIFLICITFFCMHTPEPSFSATLDDVQTTIQVSTTGAIQKRINAIGFRLLNSNRIENRVVFNYNSKCKSANAMTSLVSRSVDVCSGLLVHIDSDDELAAILAHEISHGIDSYQGPLRGYFSYIPQYISSRKYEYKSDKRAIDFMTNAGYNPLAFIVIMNKIGCQYRFEGPLSSHPLISRRMMKAYEYIYAKYPSFLVNNEYRENVYYQNFLLTSTENRQKFKEKVMEKSSKLPKYL